jgi:uncharacterized protein YaiL (DUF2058 family)
VNDLTGVTHQLQLDAQDAQATALGAKEARFEAEHRLAECQKDARLSLQEAGNTLVRQWQLLCLNQPDRQQCMTL